jgi:hypothetical protein
MKEGAGENPFESTDERTDETTAEPATETEPTPASEQPPRPRIPYKFRRSGVQDGRDRVPLFVKPETKRAEREAVRELEDRFGEDVSLTDLREAAVIAGLDRLPAVAEQLTEWGYGMTFEE